MNVQVERKQLLLLLPFLIIGVAVSAGICCSAGYGGILLPVMAVLFFAVGFVGAVVLFLIVLAVMAALVDFSRPQPVQSKIYKTAVDCVMGLLIAFSRIRLHVSGTEQLPEGRWLLVSNHRSNYDPIVTGWVLRGRELAFISKPENFRRPIVGKLVHKAGYLPIDRENDREALKTILEAARRISQNAMSFCVYPEGTRHAGTEMLPFRCGAFKIAQKANVPIVVAAIRGTDQVSKNMPWRITDVYLDICGVLDADTVKSSKTTEIGDVVRKCITSANI